MGKEAVRIIKMGGNVLNDPNTLDKALNYIAAHNGLQIVVHGGGREATEVAKKLGVETKMIGGRRITSAEMVEVVTMVYAGKINKHIVADLQHKNKNAIGLTGADLNLIQAYKRPVKTIDYGFAGDIEKVNGKTFAELLQQDWLPVLCSITHDKKGQLLNTNADTIATEIAIAIAPYFEVELNLIFEKEGVLLDPEDDQSVIQELKLAKFTKLKNEGVIYEGMIPKLENAFYGLDKGVHQVKIGSISMLQEQKNGTIIKQ